MDSQSVKTTPGPGRRGSDAGKRVKGRTRHILVETMGWRMAVVVTAASVSDPNGARRLCKRVPGACTTMRRLWGDGTARGHLLAWVLLHGRFRLQPVLRGDDQQGLLVLPRRGVVERPFAWIPHGRRFGKDDETPPESREALLSLALTRVMIRRLANR